MRLVSTAIDRYGPLAGCNPPCDDTITIIAGPNESGKTLYLESVLQLLEPAVAFEMTPRPRVNEPPAGRVTVDDGTDRHTLGTQTSLSDISPIEPKHLYTLFVIRDSDLALPENTAYYTSLIEHLGDIHTTEIESLREGLVNEGRLTPKTLNLANQEHDTKDVKEAVDDLVIDIEAYLESAKADGVDELSRERIRTENELISVLDRLETQRTAKSIAAIEDANGQLNAYSSASDRIQSLSVDGETLEKLHTLEGDRVHIQNRIDEIQSTLETKRDDLANHRRELTAARTKQHELSQRERAVERVEDELVEYRQETSTIDTSGKTVDSRFTQRRWVTAASLVGAGIAGGSSAMTGSFLAGTVATVLLGMAILAGYSHRRLRNRIATIARSERELLRVARDAGFEVDRTADVAPLVRNYRDELTGIAERVVELDARVEAVADRVDQLDDERLEKHEELADASDDIDSRLKDAGVASVDEYAALVEEREHLRGKRDRAETVLRRELGIPETEHHDEMIAWWESTLRDRRAEIGETRVTAEQYDENVLDRLKARQSELESRLAVVEDELDDHERTLDSFEKRANGISPPPVVDSTPSLQARTIDGLRTLADELSAVADAIQSNAETSRKAISILDAMSADEERKVTTLFDPDGPASKRFSQFTGGRYTEVAYDPDGGELTVERTDGRSLTPEQLSYGTRDQLYFAARLSLAEQLLGGNAGFLLLDDPFLAADPERLHNGFDILRKLADEGWQIFYLTAKPAVYDRMADEFDCSVYDMKPLE